MEKWKTIEEIGIYEVSDQGRVRSVQGDVIGKDGIVFKREGQIMTPYVNENGYQIVSLRVTGRKYSYKRKVHRLVVQAFISNPEKKKTVNHKDSNKLNNKLSNLEWQTHTENFNHARVKGIVFGGGRKLNEEKVLAIRKRILRGESILAISKEYNVVISTVINAAKGQSWGNIPELAEECRALIKSRTH